MYFWPTWWFQYAHKQRRPTLKYPKKRRCGKKGRERERERERMMAVLEKLQFNAKANVKTAKLWPKWEFNRNTWAEKWKFDCNLGTSAAAAAAAAAQHKMPSASSCNFYHGHKSKRRRNCGSITYMLPPPTPSHAHHQQRLPPAACALPWVNSRGNCTN